MAIGQSTHGWGGVVTPEAVLLELDTAGLPSRALGALIDVMVQFGMLLALVAIAGLFGAAGGSLPDWVGAIVVTIAIFLIVLGYPAITETLWNGKTVGKASIGLRVVTTDGAPIRFRQAAIRSALGIVDFYVPPFGVLAAVSSLLNRNSQRLGDMVAGTLVVRDRPRTDAAIAVTFPPPPGLENYAATLDVSALGDDAYGVVRSFLTRVFTLAPNARAALGVRLGNAVAVKLRHAPPPGVGPELYLVCVASAYQRRNGGPPVPLPPWVTLGRPPPGSFPGAAPPPAPPQYPPPQYPPPPQQ